MWAAMKVGEKVPPPKAIMRKVVPGSGTSLRKPYSLQKILFGSMFRLEAHAPTTSPKADPEPRRVSLQPHGLDELLVTSLTGLEVGHMHLMLILALVVVLALRAEKAAGPAPGFPLVVDLEKGICETELPEPTSPHALVGGA